MGLFDIFKKDKPGTDPADRWAERAADKRAQAYDRQEAIHELVKLGSPAAAGALLRRFTFVVDPSITDQEEKETAFQGILKVGPQALDVIRTFSEKAESLAWPMRILKELLSEEAFVGEIIDWLARWDTDYAKFIDPKLQLLSRLEEYKDDRIQAAVLPFLDDANETARFHAVGAVLAQDDRAAEGALIQLLLGEESVRVRRKILDGFMSRGWVIPATEVDNVQRALPEGFSVDDEGTVRRR